MLIYCDHLTIYISNYCCTPKTNIMLCQLYLKKNYALEQSILKNKLFNPLSTCPHQCSHLNVSHILKCKMPKYEDAKNKVIILFLNQH